MIRKSILSTAVYPMAVLAMLALPAAAQTKSSSCCASKAKVAKVETPAPAASDAQGQAVANATDKVVAAKSSACAIQAKAQTCSTKATECATDSVAKSADCDGAQKSQCSSSVVDAKSPVALRGQIAQTPAPKRVLAMPVKTLSQSNAVASAAPAKSACQTQAAQTSCCASKGQVVKSDAASGNATPSLSPAEPNAVAHLVSAAKAAPKADCSTKTDCATQTSCSTGAVAQAAAKTSCCSTQKGQVVNAQKGAAPVALGVSSQGGATVANLPVKAKPSATCAGKVCGGEECNAGACATPSSAAKAAPKTDCCASQGQVAKAAQGQAPTALIVSATSAPKADACGVDQSECTDAQLAAKSGCCAAQGKVAQAGLGQAPAAQRIVLSAPAKSAEACSAAKAECTDSKAECTDSVAQKAAKSECCSSKAKTGQVVQAPSASVPAANVLPVNAAPVKAVPSANCSTSTSCCSQKAQPMTQGKATKSECCSTKTKSSVVRGAAPAAPAAKVVGYAVPAKKAAAPAMVKPAAKPEACSSTATPGAAKKSSCCSSQAGKVVESASGQSVPAANIIKSSKDAGAKKEACSSTQESCGDAAKKTDCGTKSSCGSTTKVNG